MIINISITLLKYSRIQSDFSSRSMFQKYGCQLSRENVESDGHTTERFFFHFVFQVDRNISLIQVGNNTYLKYCTYVKDWTHTVDHNI